MAKLHSLTSLTGHCSLLHLCPSLRTHYHLPGRSKHSSLKLPGAPRSIGQQPHTRCARALKAMGNKSLDTFTLLNQKRSGRNAGHETRWSKLSSAHTRTSSFWSSLAISMLYWAWFSSGPSTAVRCHFYFGGTLQIRYLNRADNQTPLKYFTFMLHSLLSLQLPKPCITRPDHPIASKRKADNCISILHRNLCY